MKRNYGECTINEVADVLGLSRNTVSKVFNNKPGVSDRTRKLVQDYLDERVKPSSSASIPQDLRHRKTIVFSYRWENAEYINGLLSGIELEIRRNGYFLGLSVVDNNSTGGSYLPESVYNGSVCGILSFNVYEKEYWEEVLSLGIPAVFFDTGLPLHDFRGKADIVCAESYSSVYHAIFELHRMGRRKFAFFGYPDFCNSLHQRWNTFNKALQDLGLTPMEEACVLDNFPNDDITQRTLYQRLSELHDLPDAFICASDRQAILLLRVLKELSISVPRQIAVLGFDNLPETMRQLPTLSTIDAHPKYLGQLAVRKLLERLKDPTKPHEYVECEATMIWRESTGIPTPRADI